MPCTVQKPLSYEIPNAAMSGLNLSVVGFPGGAVVENPPVNAGDTGSIPGPGGSHMSCSN